MNIECARQMESDARRKNEFYVLFFTVSLIERERERGKRGGVKCVEFVKVLESLVGMFQYSNRGF